MAQRNFLTPYQFKNGLILKNRIIMAPMTTMSSFYDGHISTDEVNYYRKRAGGPGMIITGVANVSELGKGFEGELSVTHDCYISGLKRIANAIQIKGTKAVLQIFHAGRMSNSKVLRGEQTVSASAVAAPRSGAEVPCELSEPEILQIIEDFAQATLRAIKAGFDGIELHGANTYLLQQFVSPHSNRRSDGWGGSFEKRLRFPLAVITAVSDVINKQATKPFILGYRISPEEFETPGIRLEDTIAFVKALKDQPIDYLHMSLGHIWRTSINNPQNKAPIVKQLQKITGETLPIIGVGSIESPEEAEQVINEGIPLVAIGRELIREPQWVQKVESGDEASIRYTLSPSDYEELMIPTAMWYYLQGAFREVMHLSTDNKAGADAYLNQIAPMEGYEKKL